MKKILINFILFALSGCSVNSIISNSPAQTKIKPISISHNINAIALSSISSLSTIIPQLARYKAVLVGESHTTYGDHLNQLAIIKNLYRHWGKMAIGLEFVQYPYQQALDDYIAGKITEKQMLHQTHWYDRWRYDFRLYRPIFNYAKQQQIPLVALNTPREITKRISEVGIEGLTAKERAQLPKIIDDSNADYKKSLEKVYSQHGGKSHSKKFARFYQAQLAWDETMADQVAKFMQKHPNTRLVVLAGSGHIKNRYGIPSRLERRIKSKVAVVLNDLEDNPTPLLADYVLFSPDIELPKAGKMGIFMQDTPKGVLISKIMKNSASAKAGLKKGDFILALNGEKVKTVEEIKINMMEAKPKQKVELLVRGIGQQKISKTMILQ